MDLLSAPAYDAHGGRNGLTALSPRAEIVRLEIVGARHGMIAEARVFYLRAVRCVPFVRLCADGEGFIVLEIVAVGDDLAAHVALFDNPTMQRANDGGMRAAQGNDLVKVNVGLVIAPDVVEDVADADAFRVGVGCRQAA